MNIQQYIEEWFVNDRIDFVLWSSLLLVGFVGILSTVLFGRFRMSKRNRRIQHKHSNGTLIAVAKQLNQLNQEADEINGRRKKQRESKNEGRRRKRTVPTRRKPQREDLGRKLSRALETKANESMGDVMKSTINNERVVRIAKKKEKRRSRQSKDPDTSAGAGVVGDYFIEGAPFTNEALIPVDDSRVVEFKKAHGTDLNRIANQCAQYVCAFLNSDGGTIYFGIKETERGPVVCGMHRCFNVPEQRDRIKGNIVGNLLSMIPAVNCVAPRVDIDFLPVVAMRDEGHVHVSFMMRVRVEKISKRSIDSMMPYMLASKKAYVRNDHGIVELTAQSAIRWSAGRSIVPFQRTTTSSSSWSVSHLLTMSAVFTVGTFAMCSDEQKRFFQLLLLRFFVSVRTQTKDVIRRFLYVLVRLSRKRLRNG